MSSPPSAKRVRSTPVIGTHNGSFHCDEVFACVMLKCLPLYKDATITRTRDAETLNGCDIVVDVGGEFDHARLRYDHHQRGFEHTMHSIDESRPWVTKLSSAGLVYAHYGKEVLRQVIEQNAWASADFTDASLDILYCKMYEVFVEEIDAIDNGISQTDGEKRYRISSNISARVGFLSPRWNDETQDFDARFYKAMDMVRAEFFDRISYYVSAWFPARSIVQQAIETRFECDASGEIVTFGANGGGCPWKGHLYDLEKELAVPVPIKYVLYADQNGKWRIQCVSVGDGSFANRLSLPEPWRGIRDDALSTLTGIPGGIFVHAAGFIGGNATYDGALAMARAALSFTP